jgi:exodeoxyribonuclease VII large subunit
MKSKRTKSAEEPGLDLQVEAPGVSAQNPVSVTDLTATIRDLLEDGIGEVWVAGEISNFRAPGSGHLYFTLKDASATLAAVMFQREARRAGFVMADGQAVLARGTITVYEARGQYQIQVAEVRPRGQGSLQQRFEELKRKLATENLFDLDRKRELPVFPEVIGVVTSLQGAVLQDMLQILQRRAPGIRIKVRGVRVQGIGAAQEIAEAVNAFSDEQNVDIVIVARGGGSLEDLWAFNEEVVARALATCSVPTISAVGHETDFTIADFVADLRAPTPSAAAELLTRDWEEWREELRQLQVRMDRTTRQILTGHRDHLSRLASSYALREPRRVVRQWAQKLDDLQINLHAGAHNNIQAKQHDLRLLQARLGAHHPTRELERRRGILTQLTARLRALGPQATLDRGYALVLDGQGHPVARADKTQEGQEVRIFLGKGMVTAHLDKAQAGTTLIDAISQVPMVKGPVKRGKRKKASGDDPLTS